MFTHTHTFARFVCACKHTRTHAHTHTNNSAILEQSKANNCTPFRWTISMFCW